MQNTIEDFRNKNGWTQQDLADRCEVSRQTIISLERGRYNPSIMLAFRLSEIFDVPIEEIFIYKNREN